MTDPTDARRHENGVPGRPVVQIEATHQAVAVSFAQANAVMSWKRLFTIPHRMRGPVLRRLLNEAGFRSIQINGGFDGRPFENDTDELVVEASVD